ncbi:MAG TPA: zinc-dependent alcohol dehydrogenase family protein [Ignavibacteriaceae bacterium]|nr:zinc-dependent alcohol dehydrogenase family protein [Ignavibacteriaceae bacterium]
MKAVVYEKFKGPISIQKVDDPAPVNDGVIIKVEATGICRSDWHGWMGHDPDIKNFPHIPGHELAGVIEETGKEVKNWKEGDRVTLPFVCGCGNCPQCRSGNHQICDNQFQPGFTNWGSFAEYVSIHFAETNLVRLPDNLDFETAASLGCRFATSFRAVRDVAKVKADQWVAVHGCGGVGLSAIMIAAAFGAKVIAIDISKEKLNFAKTIGATEVVNANESENPVEQIIEISNGGAHVSIDALGNKIICNNSISSLRKRGKHIQIGLMVGENSNPPLPMGMVISKELEILGSHGMQAHKYDEMFKMITEGKLHPEKLIGKKISLEESIAELIGMDKYTGTGVSIINKFN